MKAPPEVIEAYARNLHAAYGGRVFTIAAAREIAEANAQATAINIEETSLVLRKAREMLMAPCPRCGHVQVKQ